MNSQVATLIFADLQTDHFQWHLGYEAEMSKKNMIFKTRFQGLLFSDKGKKKTKILNRG